MYGRYITPVFIFSQKLAHFKSQILPGSWLNPYEPNVVHNFIAYTDELFFYKVNRPYKTSCP